MKALTYFLTEWNMRLKIASSHTFIATVQIIIRDQIAIATINKDICHNVLKNQWDLKALIFHRYQLEAVYCVKRIQADKTSDKQTINRLN